MARRWPATSPPPGCPLWCQHELRRPDLAVVRLRPYLPMPFRPGQYARIEVAELPGVWRPYSLAGAPRRDNIVELHVRAKTEAGRERHAGLPAPRSATRCGSAGPRARWACPSTPAPGPAPGGRRHRGRAAQGAADRAGGHRRPALGGAVLGRARPRRALRHRGHRRDRPVRPPGHRGAGGLRGRPPASTPRAWSPTRSRPTASGPGDEVYLAGPPLMLAATSARPAACSGWRRTRIHHDAPGAGSDARSRPAEGQRTVRDAGLRLDQRRNRDGRRPRTA